MRNSNAIKNLSIAAEALSRISETDAMDYRTRIFHLLDTLITEDEEPPAKHPRTQIEDDEIPF